MRKRDTKLSTVSALIEFWLEYGLPLDADKFEHDTKCRNILRGQLTLPHLLFLINSRQCCVPLAIKAAEHICAPLLLLFGNPIISAHLSAVFSILSPSLGQAQRLKQLSGEGKLENNIIDLIMREEKPLERKVTIRNDRLQKYFPASYTPKQMEDVIIKLLEGWHRKRQQEQSR